MHQQSHRQLQHCVTSLSIPDVLVAATRFFARRGGVYSAFVEKRGPTHVTLRGQGGEEIVIGVRSVAEGAEVTGASYLFDQQVAQFLASLPPATGAAADATDAVLEEAALPGADSAGTGARS